MKKNFILIFFALFFIGTTAWAQTTQTIDLFNGGNLTVDLSETIETVSVFANSTDAFTSAVTLREPLLSATMSPVPAARYTLS